MKKKQRGKEQYQERLSGEKRRGKDFRGKRLAGKIVGKKTGEEKTGAESTGRHVYKIFASSNEKNYTFLLNKAKIKSNFKNLL